MKPSRIFSLSFSSLLFFLSASTIQAGSAADIPSMLDPNSANTSRQWRAIPLLTVGDRFADYIVPGLLDGTGVFPRKQNEISLLVTHELNANAAYPYKLSNGTELTGARISFFDMRKEKGINSFTILDAGLAYDTIYDREAREVKKAAQVNEMNLTGSRKQDGLSRLCSGRSIQSGTFNFSDNIYFAGEEISDRRHPHGGTIWALDVEARTLHAAPDLGRGAWENVTPLEGVKGVEGGKESTVTLLMGSDSSPAPLYLYRGRKQADKNDFLSRNGLSNGSMYCWKSDAGHTSPATFNKTGSLSAGHFILLSQKSPEKAGQEGFDQQGYADSSTLSQRAFSKGCFRFSRLEDLHNDPARPGRAVFADTGQGLTHPANDWGSVYLIETDFLKSMDKKTQNLNASLRILYDSDDVGHQDQGIRNPDNLTWAHDGMIYIQEDRASRLNIFAENGIEASIWQLDPKSGKTLRIAVVDRKTVVPVDAVDKYAGIPATWETSGIIDISLYFDTARNETLLLSTVQAHKVKGGNIIGGKGQLVESGQLIFLTNHRNQN